MRGKGGSAPSWASLSLLSWEQTCRCVGERLIERLGDWEAGRLGGWEIDAGKRGSGREGKKAIMEEDERGSC